MARETATHRDTIDGSGGNGGRNARGTDPAAHSLEIMLRSRRTITLAVVVALILPTAGVGVARDAAASAPVAVAGANGDPGGAALHGGAGATGRPAHAEPLTPGDAIDLPGGTAGFADDVPGFAIGPRGERAFVGLATTDRPASVQIVDLTADPNHVTGAITGVPVGPLAVAPDGRELDILGPGVGATISVADLTATPPAVRNSAELDGAYSSMVLSPDGRVAYVGEDLGFDHSLRALDTRTFRPTGFAADTSMDVAHLALSPDGSTLLAIGGWDDRAIAVDTRTAAVATLRGDGSDGTTTAIAFSADGSRALLAVRSDAGPRIVALDPHSGAVLARSPVLKMSTVSDIAVSPDGRFVYAGGAVEPLVTVLAAGSLRIAQHLTLPTDSGLSLRVAGAGPHYGTVYALQGGDIMSPDGHPVLTPLAQHDPGPSVRPRGPRDVLPAAATGGTGARSPWTIVIIVLGVIAVLVLVGVVILLAGRRAGRPGARAATDGAAPGGQRR